MNKLRPISLHQILLGRAEGALSLSGSYPVVHVRKMIDLKMYHIHM